MGPVLFLFLVQAAFAQSAPVSLESFQSDDIAVRTDYSVYALGSFADPLGMEADLNALEVDARSASLLRTDPEAVTRVALSGGGEGAVEMKGRDNCADLNGEWWPGNVLVRLADRRRDANPPTSLVFVENNPSLGAVAELSPGDSVEQRSVREGGRLVSQSVTFVGNERLVIRKTNGRSSVCSK